MLSTGSVLAKDHKASICHNGSTYNSDTQMEDPIAFVITIAGRDIARAVEKHVANHGDHGNSSESQNLTITTNSKHSSTQNTKWR